MEKEKKVLEHDHPLTLMDLWLEQLKHEEDKDEDEEEEEDQDDLIANQDFLCLCSRCHEEISWYHRYYYSCTQCSDYTIHKFCAELPESVEDFCEVGHTLGSNLWYLERECDICGRPGKPEELLYYCRVCYFFVDINCVTKRLQKNIIHHPSHKHPLVGIPKQILDRCDACGKEHKGFFYHCTTCVRSNFIHSHCAFLPKKLQIQHTTNDVFSHIHPLTLAYSFPYEDQISKHKPRCRVCFDFFKKPNLWIYKCEKCRYYAHLACVTSRDEPFMSILSSRGTSITFKNYEDSQHPNLLHLPFLDPPCSILKHLFFKEDIGSTTCKTQNNINHQHPLILEDAQYIDIGLIPTSSRIKPISYHDPMKKIELLCDGCVRPITSGPIYMCANEEEDHCNFVLHEWCSRLPTKVIDHPGHTQHTLILHSKIPGKFFGVFACNICELHCNGFVYCCDICNYHVDVKCAFLPKEITHSSHPNHLLSRKVNMQDSSRCRMCSEMIYGFSFDCDSCDFHLHQECALLIPETTTHKCDKHSMKLSYFPIENHISEYFCEVCEKEFDPKLPFYHCRECMQSMHTACAPSILQYETYTTRWFYDNAIHKFVNVKFGGTYMNTKVHPHPLSFVQGIENDGECSLVCDDDDDDDECSLVCDDDDEGLQYRMIFKCLDCKFAIHYECCERMNNRYI